MKDFNENFPKVLQEALGSPLRLANLDLIDIVPIPATGDRMVRLRTLEEALEEFDRSEEQTIGYLVQLRRTRPNAEISEPEVAALGPGPRPSLDGIYLPNGKLNIPYLLETANLLLGASDFALAKNVYKTVLQSGEKPSLALFGMARCFEAEGKVEEARTHYEEALAYHPSLETYRCLSSLLILQKKDLMAAETIARALTLKELTANQRFELHKAAGNCFTRAQKSQEAETHFRKALEFEPSSDEIRCSLGALYFQNGNIQEAKRQFQEANTVNPRNERALSGLGTCLLADGDKRAAHDAFARVLEIQLNNPTAIFHLVKCAYEIRSYATAARIVEDYIEIAPVNANLLYSLAGLQFHLGRIHEAGATTRRILELVPNHAGATELAGMIERYGAPHDLPMT